MRVLAKGLNYARTPEKIPYEIYILASEVAAKSLISLATQQTMHEAQATANALQSEAVNILTKAGPPKHNIGKEDRTLIKALEKQGDILLLLAHKGKATVIMDKEEYTTKLNTMAIDPAPKLNKKLIALLTWKRQRKLPHRIIGTCTPLQICYQDYMGPKIH